MKKFRSYSLQNKNQKGFTLVELLVAIALGIFLLWAMTKLFINNKSLIVTQNNVAKIQDDSRFSLFLMENDISLAGFRGCSSGIISPGTGTNFYNAAGASSYLNSTNFIQGATGGGTSFTPGIDSSISSLSPAPNPKMDVITIRTATSDPAILTADMGNATSSLALSSSSTLNAGGNAIISNCYSSSLFNISSISGNSVTPSSSLTAVYPMGSQVYPYNTITYYVGTDNTLYRSLNNGTPAPLAYNIEKFSILYGVDTDSNFNVNQYVFASSVSNFNQVVSVRIGMVIKTNDLNTLGTAKNAYTYTFNGVATTPNDSKLRKIYYTTVTLRNMVL